MITGKNKSNSFNNLIMKRKSYNNSNKVNKWIRITIIRIGASVIIVGLAMVIQILDFKPTNTALEYVKYNINQEANITNYIKEVEKIPTYVASIGNKAVEAIKMEDELERNFVSPVYGEVSTYFNENIGNTSNVSKGIIFDTTEGKDIYSVGDGVIIDIGSNKAVGNYIIIKHKGELVSVYKYVGDNYLELNERVEKGQKIGSTTEKLLLEIWNRNEPTDPIKYINFSTKQL